MVYIDVTTTGPLFDGRTEQAIHDFLEEAKDVVAHQGLADVHFHLDQSIQHPTPYYETQITIDRQADDRVIHDRGIIYGPRLEGTGSRNITTRFKGYATFRLTTQELERKWPGLVEPILARYTGRM